MGDIYFTPQQKIIAQVGNREQYVQQESSEYINEYNEGSNAPTSRINRANRDEYMLPPQDREDTPEIRPRKEKKENVQDIYDEGHYSLARNSGFDKDFSTSVMRNSKVVERQSKHWMQKSSHLIVVSAILVLFAIGGVIAYVMIDRTGNPFIGS